MMKALAIERVLSSAIYIYLYHFGVQCLFITIVNTFSHDHEKRLRYTLH